ncbi:MAG: hypothetical protein Q8S31_09940 [Alphaproteobacteria bacterium]|nr:hypothetical protein [Alphaproteobacteria bacterium]
MKKTLFVLITSLLFQSNAFSGGNTGLKRDRAGDDAGVTLEEIHKKQRTVKNQIIQDIECRQLNLNDYESCLGEFFEESRKLLTNIDLMDLMQEALLKIARDPKEVLALRYKSAKLLYMSEAKDFFDINHTTFAHRAAGISAIEEIVRSCPLDVLNLSCTENNVELVSLLLEKVKNHFIQEKSKCLGITDDLFRLEEVRTTLRKLPDFKILSRFIDDFRKLDSLNRVNTLNFIKFYFGGDNQLFDYLNFLEKEKVEVGRRNSIISSLMLIRDSACPHGLINLADRRDDIVACLYKIRSESRCKITQHVVSILGKGMDADVMLFLLGTLPKCTHPTLLSVTVFLKRFSWEKIKGGIWRYFYTHAFPQMIQHINANVDEFENFADFCFLNLKESNFKIKNIIDLYHKIYLTKSSDGSVVSKNILKKLKKNPDFFNYVLGLNWKDRSFLLDNPHYYVLHKTFSPFIHWGKFSKSFDALSHCDFFDKVKNISEKDIANIVDVMKKIQVFYQNDQEEKKLLKIPNTKLFILSSKLNISSEEYFKKIKEFIHFLDNKFGEINADDFNIFLEYLENKSDILFLNDIEKLSFNLNINFSNINDFLTFFNIFDILNDKEYQKLLTLFTVDEIKKIKYLYLPKFADLIQFILPLFSDGKNKIIIEHIGEYFLKTNCSYEERMELIVLKKIILFANKLPDAFFKTFIMNIAKIVPDALVDFGEDEIDDAYRYSIDELLYGFYINSDERQKKELIHFLPEALISEDELLVSGVSYFISERYEDVGLTEEDELVQLAIRVQTLLDQSQDPQNPYKIHRDLNDKRKAEISFENLQQFQFIKGSSQDYRLCLNPSFFKKLSEMQVDLSSAPSIDPMIIRVMLHVIEARLNPNLLSQIQTIAGMRFGDIKEGAIGKNNYLENLLKCDNSYIAAQLKCILHNLSQLETKDGSDAKLSTQEMAIVKTFASILNCSTGRDGAINEAYLQLDNEFKLQTMSKNIFDSIAMDRNLATTPKACEFLYGTLNGLVENMFSGTNDLMLDICKEGTIEDIKEPVHQGLYLRNLIGDLVGSWHRVKFDLHAQLYYTPLLALLRQEALELFYKHAHASLRGLIQIVQTKINNQINALDGAALYCEFFQLLGEDVSSFELDEKDAPMITLDGTIKVLVQIGALEEDDRLF